MSSLGAVADPGWSTRLRAVFGAALDQVEEEQLQALVDTGAREYADLDFKAEIYGNGDSERRELAGDIAAFANDRGGVIVIGVREENEIATELTPVALNTSEWGRMRQIATDNVTPYATFEVRVVESRADPAKGYYLLIVPPSPERPHAVRKNQDLRYPRRDGTQKRWLSESEVADAYRDRFARATTDVARVGQVLREGLAAVAREANSVHLVVVLVPSQAGFLQIDAAKLRAVEEWARGQSDLWGQSDPFAAPFDGGGGPVAGVGIRRIRFGTSGSQGLNTVYACAEVHVDGAVFVSRRMILLNPAESIDRAPSDQPKADERRLSIADLTLKGAGCLRAAARLSSEITGAFGDCAASVQLDGSALRLVAYSGDGLPLVLGREGVDGPIVSEHTLVLDSLTRMSTNLLLATRTVCADVVQAFGAPELPTLSPKGHPVRRAFPSGYHQDLEAWSQTTGISLE
jgi:hypothetical protein